MQRVPTTEGFIPFYGYRTWYRIVGEREEPGKLPLLVLHGGPGASHDYLEPLAVMAQTGRRSGRYDEATPLVVEPIHRSIPGSEWILFENSSHMPHVEETERYVHALEAFFQRIERDTLDRNTPLEK